MEFGECQMKHKSWTVLPFLCIPSLCCHAQAITDSAMRSSTIANAGVPAAKVQTNGTLPAATSVIIYLAKHTPYIWFNSHLKRCILQNVPFASSSTLLPVNCLDQGYNT